MQMKEAGNNYFKAWNCRTSGLVRPHLCRELRARRLLAVHRCRFVGTLHAAADGGGEGQSASCCRGGAAAGAASSSLGVPAAAVRQTEISCAPHVDCVLIVALLGQALALCPNSLHTKHAMRLCLRDFAGSGEAGRLAATVGEILCVVLYAARATFKIVGCTSRTCADRGCET